MIYKTSLLAALLGLVLMAGPATAVVTTVYEIQLGAFGLEEEVTVENVVVTATAFYGFFVQEQEPHPTWQRMYSGIFVHTHGFHLGDVKRGDVVNVTGAYQEYYDFSEIDLFYSPCGETMECSYEIVGTAELPDAVAMRIDEVNDGGDFNEAYESVLIRVDRDDPDLFAGPPNAFDEWLVWTEAGQQGDSLWVDRYSADPNGDFNYSLPYGGEELEFLQGILVYNYGNYKLAPRNCPEDIGWPCPPVLMGTWAYSNSRVDVKFAMPVDLTSAQNIYNYDFDSGLPILNAERDADDHSIVHLTTGTQTPGYVETIYVEGVLSEGELVEMPPGEYTFAQGVTPIYTIQYVEDVLNDASPLIDMVATTTGRVTATEGNYYYLQQGAGGPFKSLYARISKIGDVAVGDSVLVAGRVTEYYGLTQLNFTNGVQLFENLGHAVDPVTTAPLDADQMLYDAVMGDNNPPDDNLPEPWESALVRLNQPAHLDTVPGGVDFGEWYLVVDADTCRTDLIHEINDGGSTIVFEPEVGDTIEIGGILAYDGRYSMTYSIVPRTQHWDMRIYEAAVGDLPLSIARMLLQQNRPNPFGPATAIAFRLPHEARSVDVAVYDVNGALVRQLVTRAGLPAGPHTFEWDGTNDAGRRVTSGNYFYRLTVDGESAARQMLLLR